MAGHTDDKLTDNNVIFKYQPGMQETQKLVKEICCLLTAKVLYQNQPINTSTTLVCPKTYNSADCEQSHTKDMSRAPSLDTGHVYLVSMQSVKNCQSSLLHKRSDMENQSITQ